MVRLFPLLLVLIYQVLLGSPHVQAQDSSGDEFTLRLRSRSDVEGVAIPVVVNKDVTWSATETAVIVCDMWDRHHCFNASQRGAEIAPRLNAFVNRCRSQGMKIIHAPSDCLEAYANHPARANAERAPVAANLPAGIDNWKDWLSKAEEAAYPIDQSDGGVDDSPEDAKKWRQQLVKEQRDPERPWRKQTDVIKIEDSDFVTDVGSENWNIQESHGIKNVIVTGVHTNMCVLGRPFGLRQMVANGRNVVLVRDLTDTMYNPASAPFVNHFSGTDLIVDHIERFICPTVTSDQILKDDIQLRLKEDTRKHIVAVIAEDEYETDRTIANFVSQYLNRDYKVSFVLEMPVDDSSLNESQEIKTDHLSNWEAIRDADLLLLSVRRKVLPTAQLDAIAGHVADGKPVLAIRTSSHAFCTRTKTESPEGFKQWPDFDVEVLGGKYSGHYGNKDGEVKTFVSVEPQSTELKIMAGVDAQETVVRSWLYKSSPLSDSATVLMMGHVSGVDLTEPVTWLNKTKQGGDVFYTSLGHPEDFQQGFFQRLLRNAVEHLLESSDEPSPNKDEAALKVSDDLKLELLMQQPIVANPLYMNFDARGRLWLTEYRQYPWPAGLKLVSRDGFWRNVYQPAFAPAPPFAEDSPFRGEDRISIHEDTNGDGQYDSHKVFLDGLNLATAALKGRGGVFVMNPPRLLFYADADEDDVPDSLKPKILLSGFGIEDSHAIANSLRWGPDGWIYAAQGSTVSSSVVTHGSDGEALGPPVHSVGQNIWRYHPEENRYEIFAEGGGNAFGVEFDAAGHVFSGHNGGNTRGFHYVQGGFYAKNFGKHGSLSNPYTLGFFPAMKHPQAPRFTHTFEIYSADVLPEKYQNKIIAIAPHIHEVMLSDMSFDGSTRQTKDIQRIIEPGSGQRSDWFTPVDVQTGPDGAVYIADWFSSQSNHYKNHQGETNPELGRVYRLTAKTADSSIHLIEDLSQLSQKQLINKLGDSNPWKRETALRLLVERHDENTIKKLDDVILNGQPLQALSAFQAAYQIDPQSTGTNSAYANHPNSDIRRWHVRLTVDYYQRLVRASPDPSMAMDRRAFEFISNAALGKNSTAEIRSQLAASARFLPVQTCVDLLGRSTRQFDDSTDPHIPLLTWWAIESHAGDHIKLLKAFDVELWENSPLRVAEMTIAECLAFRWAMENTAESLNASAEILAKLSKTSDEKAKLLLPAFAGRSDLQLPPSMIQQFDNEQGVYTSILKIQTNDAAAIQRGVDQLIRIAENNSSPNDVESLLITTLGNIVGKNKQVSEGIKSAFSKATEPALVKSMLAAAARINDQSMGNVIISRLKKMSTEVQAIAMTTLAGRSQWATTLINAANSGEVDADLIDESIVDRMKLHTDPSLQTLLKKNYPKQFSQSEDQNKLLEERVKQIANMVNNHSGNTVAGEMVFASETTACAKCHRMFDIGGDVGPDLTAYNRSDLRSMIRSIIAPSVEVREGYESWTVLTLDGQVVIGVKTLENASQIGLRDANGQTVMIAKSEIDELQPAKKSLMPEGLLRGLRDQEIADLFAYLRSFSSTSQSD